MPRKKTSHIPVNNFGGEYHSGISIDTMSLMAMPDFAGDENSERHDRHSFHLLDKGEITMEIDFETYEIQSPSIIYLHPNQIHRIVSFKDVTVSSLGINDESLNAEYLGLLESITPVKPLLVNNETYVIISEAHAFCLKLSGRRKDPLYHSLLKDACNTLVAIVLSQFLEHTQMTDNFSRYEAVSKAFKDLLEKYYRSSKRPSDYAEKLHLSPQYLNECVKNTTGHSVSHHVQQRVILEAKRWLYHSNKSVKEIATELGYDDYPYFTRLFKKVTGLSAVAFRHKNRD